MVQEQKAAAKARHPSGFVLLSGAQAAYSSRLALWNLHRRRWICSTTPSMPT